MLNGEYFHSLGNDQYKVMVGLPVIPYRDIFDGSSVDTGTQLRNKLKKLLDKLEDALEKGDEIKQCKILNWLFGDDFKVPEKKSESSKAKVVYPTAGVAGTSHGA